VFVCVLSLFKSKLVERLVTRLSFSQFCLVRMFHTVSTYIWLIRHNSTESEKGKLMAGINVRGGAGRGCEPGGARKRLQLQRTREKQR
jgi:hypothetical protein